LFNVDGMHVLEVVHDAAGLVVTVETDQDVGACPACGVVAVGHGRRVHSVADAPCFGVPVRLRWLKRVWRCAEPACPTGTFSERHES
jgi:transposase